MSDITEKSLIVPGRTDDRRGGRPRAPEPGCRVSSWVPEKHADALMRQASYQGVSVSEYVRTLIVRAVTRR